MSAPRLELPADARRHGPAVGGPAGRMVPGAGVMALIRINDAGLGLLNVPPWLQRAYELDLWLAFGAVRPWYALAHAGADTVTGLEVALSDFAAEQNAYGGLVASQQGRKVGTEMIWSFQGRGVVSERNGAPLFTTQEGQDDNDLGNDHGWDLQGWRPVKPAFGLGGEGVAS